MSNALGVRLLGRVEALVDGKPLALDGRRPRALLTVLALAAGQWVPVEALYERVWGADAPQDVRGSLYTCIRRLRKVLGADAIAGGGGRYRLCADPDAVDAVRFGRLLDRARTADTQAPALLDEALALWQGPPFGDEALSEWLNEGQARRLTERWLGAVLDRADQETAAGRYDGLVDELGALTRDYPLREPIWARYLVALDGAGRHADALAAYEEIRVRLADELGIDPSPELQGLYSDLLAGGVSRAPRATPVAEVVPRQLPAGTAAFVGRAEALTSLDALLPTPDRSAGGRQTIGVVHGLGGAGKTALAVHWSHRVADRFPDGQLFVDLQGFGPGEPLSAATALDLLLRGLGVPAERIPADAQARSALLRSAVAGKRLLILLDNARDPDQVRPLIPPGCLVLVTSRAQLRGLATREGARLIPLDAMRESESVWFLRTRLDGAADDEALARIAGLCGQLPLTLAMAVERANRHPDAPLGDLIAELEDERSRLDALGDPDDPLSDVRAVFSWSYQALDPDSARMFRCLGACPTPDLSLEAAAALADTSPSAARRLLDRLISASMLTRTEQGRFRLHDLVRTYAVELVHEADAERDAAFDRLCRWALRSATNALRTIRPRTLVLHPEVQSVGPAEMRFDDEDAALSWQHRETPFLIALAEVSTASHPWTTIGLARLLIGYSLGPSAGATTGLQQTALGAARAVGSPPAEAIMLISIGYDHYVAGDHSVGLSELRSARGVLDRIDDPDWRAHILNNLALVFRTVGDLGMAIGCYRQAFEHASARESALTHNNYAVALIHASLIGDALVEARQAVDLARQAGGAYDQAMTLDTLGQVLTASGDHAGATACFTEALELQPPVGPPGDRAIVLSNLAHCQLSAGHREAAEDTARAAIALIDEHHLVDNSELRRSDVVELLARIATKAS